MKKFFGVIAFVFSFLNAYGVIYTSSDNIFTIDMPSGWTSSAKAGSVLSLKKGEASLDFKPIECIDEACLDKKIAADLTAVKAKKMTVVGNTYTGEEIKRIEFSTGEPFVYINFSNTSTDFSAGYFIFHSKGYSVLSQNMSYAETDLIFSFLSPVKQAPQNYDTYALPAVQDVAVLELPGMTLEDEPAAPAPPVLLAVAPDAPPAEVAAQEQPKPKTPRKSFTLVNKSMPSYIRALGGIFDFCAALFLLYVLVVLGALVFKFFRRSAPPEIKENTPYPVEFKRLYGTPSLIYRSRDMEDKNYISFTTRWSAAFMACGAFFALGACVLMCILSAGGQSGIINLSAYALGNIYSFFGLVIPIGVFLFVLGAVIRLVSKREFTIYDASGKKAVYVIEKGFSFKLETFNVYYAHSDDVYTLVRKRFSLLRKWDLLSPEGEEVATFSETEPVKAVFRRLAGHLWGMLRASYIINGRLESKGFIKNSGSAFNSFVLYHDNVSAADPLEITLAAFIINIRDADKYYPWIN